MPMIKDALSAETQTGTMTPLDPAPTPVRRLPFHCVKPPLPEPEAVPSARRSPRPSVSGHPPRVEHSVRPGSARAQAPLNGVQTKSSLVFLVPVEPHESGTADDKSVDKNCDATLRRSTHSPDNRCNLSPPQPSQDFQWIIAALGPLQSGSDEFPLCAECFT